MSEERRPALPVEYAPIAFQDLQVVRDRNEKTYGCDHAERYVNFLRQHIDALGESYFQGRVVESRPKLRYIRISRRSRGHGHVAVYRVDANKVAVLHIFHTAQDWQTNLAEENPSR